MYKWESSGINLNYILKYLAITIPDSGLIRTLLRLQF
jgi:hypothetical protein